LLKTTTRSFDEIKAFLKGENTEEDGNNKVNVIEGKKYWVLRKNRRILLCVLL
jgi:hypothetical protein